MRTISKSLELILFPLSSMILAPDLLNSPPIRLEVPEHFPGYLLIRDECVQDILYCPFGGNSSEVERAAGDHGWHDKWIVRHGHKSIQVRSRRWTALRVLYVPGGGGHKWPDIYESRGMQDPSFGGRRRSLTSARTQVDPRYTGTVPIECTEAVPGMLLGLRVGTSAHR